jgi:hypothetical protein
VTAESDLKVVFRERRCPNDIHPASEMNLTKLLPRISRPSAKNADFFDPEHGRAIALWRVAIDVGLL